MQRVYNISFGRHSHILNQSKYILVLFLQIQWHARFSQLFLSRPARIVASGTLGGTVTELPYLLPDDALGCNFVLVCVESTKTALLDQRWVIPYLQAASRMKSSCCETPLVFHRQNSVKVLTFLAAVSCPKMMPLSLAQSNHSYV